MKKLLLPLVVFAATPVLATVHTVSNDPAKPAQFTSAATAFAAAAPGDTLYVYSSLTDYGDLSINKPITIIGPGYSARKEMYAQARFNIISLLPGSFGNVTLDGLNMTQFFMVGSAVYNWSNVTLRNCLMSVLSHAGGNVTCGSQINNWLFENCVFGTFQFGYACTTPLSPLTTGLVIKNSVINYTLSRTHSALFVNCQIGGESNGSFNNMQANVFSNCIFTRMDFQQFQGNNGNSFQNCLTYLTAAPSPTFDLASWTGGATGTASGCIINQNPLWQTPPQNHFFFGGLLSTPTTWNPVLLPGSPAMNAGTDGTDIGLTGGPQPYTVYAEPNVPVVRRYQLVNPVVPANGTISIKATATKAH